MRTKEPCTLEEPSTTQTIENMLGDLEPYRSDLDIASLKVAKEAETNEVADKEVPIDIGFKAGMHKAI